MSPSLPSSTTFKMAIVTLPLETTLGYAQTYNVSPGPAKNLSSTF